MWRNVATPLAWVMMMHLVSDRLNRLFGMCFGRRHVRVVCGRNIFFKTTSENVKQSFAPPVEITSIMWNNFLPCRVFQSSGRIYHQGYIWVFFSAGLCVCSERRWKNKSNWKTFWRAVICYASTKAGGLTVVLDLIKGEWMMLSYTAESAVCTAHLLQ